MSGFKIFGIVVVGLVVIAGICVGGWRLGWWLNAYSTSKNAQILQTSYGAQTANIQQVRADIILINQDTLQIDNPAANNIPASEIPQLKAVRQSTTNAACALANEITSIMPRDINQFYQTSCVGT